MNLQSQSTGATIPLLLLRRVVEVCDRFEFAWRADAPPPIEQFLNETVAAERTVVLLKLLELDLELRTRAGATPQPPEYYHRFPDDRSVIDAAFASFAGLPVPMTPSSAVGTAFPRPAISNYDLLESIGEGGMGVVYKARQRGADRDVALKLIRPELLVGFGAAAGAEFVQRLLKEGRDAASLTHDNIVPVYEVGEEGGTPYISMRLVDGETLSEAIRNGPLVDRRAAKILALVARAVQHAHERGVLHRDLKPRNVLLDESDRPFVTDFGLARRGGETTGLTATEGMVGTPAYAAPEQVRGETALPATDVYGLGATLYELLTGRPPLLGSGIAATLQRVLDEDPIPPRRLNPAIARDLETICLKCLAKDPLRRYQTAAALADDLDRFLLRLPILARRVSTVERAWKWGRRRPTAAALVAVLIAAVPLGIGAFVLTDRQIQTARLDGLVNSLETAETADLPKVLAELELIGPRATPRLRQLFNQSSEGSRAKTKAAIALLRIAGAESDYVVERAMESDPAELRVIRDSLRERDAIETLWATRANTSAPSSKRLRTSCLLAAISPDDPRWDAVAPALTSELVTESPALASAWAELLRPVAGRLDQPLRRTFADRSRPEWGQTAAVVLAEFHRDDATALVELIINATPGQFPALADQFRRDPVRGIQAITEAAKVVKAEATTNDSAIDRRLERLANLALALVRLGVAPSDLLNDEAHGLAHYPFVARLAGSGLSAADAFRLLSGTTDSRFRRAVLLGLGDMPVARVLDESREDRIERIAALFRDDPDPGVHSAAEWLLRKWDVQTPAQKKCPPTASKSPGWMVTESGITMATFPNPGRVNSPDLKLQQHKPVDDFGPFAIALKEVTTTEFGRSDVWDWYRDRPPRSFSELPIGNVTPYEAAAYCLWLDQLEKLPKNESCYILRNPQDRTTYQLKGNYRDLSGFRLPTEAEWEYACENHTTCKEYLARTEKILQDYSWYRETARNQSHPVGTLKPNRNGLFDWHGNVAEWCVDQHIDQTTLRQVYHGLSAEMSVAQLVTLPRGPGTPTHRAKGCGFRIARSLPQSK